MENLNSCCYVAKVKEIISIPNADNIEQIIVNGWSCITKKGEYTQDQLVIITTTDAVIPQELSDNIGITSYLRKGNRVRTVKLRGVYSECLIIPPVYVNKELTEGKCFMDELSIYKFEPPVKQIQLASGKKIRFSENPNFNIYYKFPNFKNVPDLFQPNDYVQVTRKYHGTNARFALIKKTKLSFFDKIKKLFGNKLAEYDYVVGSHNVMKGADSVGFYDENVWFTISNKLNIKNKLINFAKENLHLLKEGIIIHGEIYGPGIQKNFDYGLSEIKFKVFDIEINNVYQSTYNTKTITYELGLEHVEILESGFYENIDINKYVINNFIDNSKVPHEGVVIKLWDGNKQKRCKIINPDYLIYGEKNNVGDSH